MILFYECLILGFGLFETISNLFYMRDSGGVLRAYNQHKEVPSYVSHQVMKTKMKTMLVVGLLFIACGTMALLFTNYAVYLVRFIISAYAMYTLVEALYYKNHKLGWALAILITLLAVSSFLLI